MIRRWLREFAAILKGRTMGDHIPLLLEQAMRAVRRDQEAEDADNGTAGGPGPCKKRRILNMIAIARMRLQDLANDDGMDGLNQHQIREDLAEALRDLDRGAYTFYKLTAKLGAHGLEQARSAVRTALESTIQGDLDWVAPSWGEVIGCYVHPADVVALEEAAEEAPAQPSGGTDEHLDLLTRNLGAVAHFLGEGREQLRQFLAAVLVWRQANHGMARWWRLLRWLLCLDMVIVDMRKKGEATASRATVSEPVGEENKTTNKCRPLADYVRFETKGGLALLYEPHPLDKWIANVDPTTGDALTAVESEDFQRYLQGHKVRRLLAEGKKVHKKGSSGMGGIRPTAKLRHDPKKVAKDKKKEKKKKKQEKTKKTEKHDTMEVADLSEDNNTQQDETAARSPDQEDVDWGDSDMDTEPQALPTSSKDVGGGHVGIDDDSVISTVGARSRAECRVGGQVLAFFPRDHLFENFEIDALRFDERGPKLAKKRSLIPTWKIRPGDIVFVNSGKDKKSTGEVLMVDHRRNMVKVKGLNLRKVLDDEGSPKFIEKKIHYSNCALIDPAAGRPTRVGLTFTEDGDAIRISHLTGHIIPWPDLPKHMQKRDEDQVEGPKDTPPEVALRKTYDYHADKEALRLARLAMTKYNYNR
ncbi:MRPL24 [Symbiodinium sp. KB8]|nr:MRPL24 [Symbiodinium sp. KB8]